MRALQATVLEEDNLLLRRCVHGIAHPVGHLSAPFFQKAKHERRHSTTDGIGDQMCSCDGCCATW